MGVFAAYGDGDVSLPSAIAGFYTVFTWPRPIHWTVWTRSFDEDDTQFTNVRLLRGAIDTERNACIICRLVGLLYLAFLIAGPF